MLKKINDKINEKIKETTFTDKTLNLKGSGTLTEITSSQISIFLVWFVISTLIVAIPFFSNKVNLKGGEVAHYSVFSPVNIEFETAKNREQTEKLRESRAELVENVYDIDNNATEKVKNKIASYFTKIVQLRKMDLNSPGRIEFKKKLDFELSHKNLATLINADQNIMILVEDYILRTVDNLMSVGIEDAKSLETKSMVVEEVSKIKISIKYKNVIQELISKAIVSNKTFNLVATNEKKSESRASVAPVKTRLREKQPIFYKGDKITGEHVEILKT